MKHACWQRIRGTINKSDRQYPFCVAALIAHTSETHYLQLILPELLLLGLVEKGEIANMVHENITKDREFGIDGGDFAKL